VQQTTTLLFFAPNGVSGIFKLNSSRRYRDADRGMPRLVLSRGRPRCYWEETHSVNCDTEGAVAPVCWPTAVPSFSGLGESVGDDLLHETCLSLCPTVSGRICRGQWCFEYAGQAGPADWSATLRKSAAISGDGELPEAL